MGDFDLRQWEKDNITAYCDQNVFGMVHQEQQPLAVSDDPEGRILMQVLDDYIHPQATAQANKDHSFEGLVGQSLTIDWSIASQRHEQLPQQPELQQQATMQPDGDPKPRINSSAGPTAVRKKNKRIKVAIERSVRVSGNSETITSHCTPDFAASVGANERDLIKDVKNPKRLGLAKGLKASKYRKRCQGSDCNQYATDCQCPGGFVG